MSDSRPFAPSGALRALGYRLLRGFAEGFLKAANACLYLAAGLLRQDDFRTASQIRWRHFGLAVDDVDAGLEVWERRLLDDLVRPSDRVLLVGCGAGRDLLALREIGCNVTGVEPVPELVTLARENLVRRGLNATVLTGFVETVHLDEQYDVILFSNGCYSFLPHHTSRVATLARLKAHLSPDGRIVIVYSAFVRRSPVSAWLTRISARVAQADWRPEPGDTFSRDHLVPSVLRYEHRFGPGEVARECAEAGLRVIREEVMNGAFRRTVAVV